MLTHFIERLTCGREKIGRNAGRTRDTVGPVSLASDRQEIFMTIFLIIGDFNE